MSLLKRVGTVKDADGSVAGSPDGGLCICEDAAETFVINYSIFGPFSFR